MESAQSWLQPFGNALELISAKDANLEELWYLSPNQHAAELLFFNAVFISGLFYLSKWDNKINGGNKVVHEVQQLTPTLKVYRTILTLCLMVTVCHKYLGNKLCFMLMPCHCATACYLYCLYTTDKKKAETAFNVSAHFLFYTFLAILMPDFRSLTLPGEIINFWVHHWILLIIPLHLICTKFYNLEASKRTYHFLLAACWGGLVHFDVMGVAGIISGLNVGYMLHPPRHTPFKGMWFRWGHAAFLIFMGAFCGYLLIPFIHKVTNFVNNKLGWNTSKAATTIVDGEYILDGDRKYKTKTK